VSGWITLHRQIKDHWVFENADYFKAWVTMLMEVNHDNHKTLIKGKLLTCSRGESLLSHNSWALKFGKGWDRYKVMRFFKLLESDGMIRTNTAQVTTRLIVNNYAKYQDKTPKDCTPESTENAHKVHTKRTQLNNDNNDNNIKTPKKFTPPTVEQVAAYCKKRGNSVDANSFVNHYEANGWMRGKNKVKSWEACVRYWESNDKKPTNDMECVA